MCPSRTRAHELETESEAAFRAAIPSRWVFRRKSDDYGIDGEVEIFYLNGKATTPCSRSGVESLRLWLSTGKRSHPAYHRWPRKITLDGHKPSHLGLRRLRREEHRWKYVLVRMSRYLNNVVEQDHRAIKGRCRPMLGFKSYRTAAVTLAGLELVHRIRKRQFKFGPRWWSRWSLKKQWDVALA